MSGSDTSGRTPRISDERVKAKTGKTWGEWIATIEEHGYGSLGRKGISSELERTHRVDPWWAHAISIEYQYARGLHHPSQRYAVTVSRTIAVDPKRVFAAWSEPAGLNAWFTSGAEQEFHVGGRYRNGDGDFGEFLVIVPNKSIRFTWNSKHHQPGSEVGIRISPVEEGSRIELHHEKLSSEKDANDLRDGWSWALDSLCSYLETGKPVPWNEWVAAHSQAGPEGT
jgi:uncharacterized protein YndB with AHSA1/START domain